jgi:hypothetical protein
LLDELPVLDASDDSKLSHLDSSPVSISASERHVDEADSQSTLMFS